jgi:hypothetical protein
MAYWEGVMMRLWAYRLMVRQMICNDMYLGGFGSNVMSFEEWRL